MLGYSECKVVSELLWNYTAQRLTDEQNALVEAHLLRCSSCREELEAYRQTVGALSGFRRSAVPESRANWRDLQARLTAPPARRPFLSPDSWRFSSLAWGSMAAAAVLGLVFMMRPFDQNAAIPTQHNAETVQPSPSIAEKQPAPSVARSSHETRTAPITVSTVISPKKAVARNIPARNPVILERHHSRNAIHWSPAAPNESHLARLQRRPASPPALDYASADGGRAASAADAEDFVLSPVSSTPDSDMPRNYVIGSVASTTRTVSATYNSDDTEEANGW
jgi:hypothetical protein